MRWGSGGYAGGNRIAHPISSSAQHWSWVERVENNVKLRCEYFAKYSTKINIEIYISYIQSALEYSSKFSKFYICCGDEERISISWAPCWVHHVGKTLEISQTLILNVLHYEIRERGGGTYVSEKEQDKVISWSSFGPLLLFETTYSRYRLLGNKYFTCSALEVPLFNVWRFFNVFWFTLETLFYEYNDLWSTKNIVY